MEVGLLVVQPSQQVARVPHRAKARVPSAGRVIEWRTSADKQDMRDWLYSYYCGAGRGTRMKYRETIKHWRRRAFPRLRLVFVGLAVALFVVARLDHAISAGWVLGLALGAVLAVYIAVRDAPPPNIEKWRTDLEGERRTAKALAPLRRHGYRLLHDLPDRRTGDQARKGNIDHVVVSTAGVFVIESKYLGGEVSIEGDTAHIQTLDDDEEPYACELGRRMRGLAVRLKEDIGQGGVGDVQAVVVFWNPFPAGMANGHRVVYLHGDRLAGWLQALPPKIAPETVTRVADAIVQARPRAHKARWERLATFGSRHQRVVAESSPVGTVAPRN